MVVGTDGLTRRCESGGIALPRSPGADAKLIIAWPPTSASRTLAPCYILKTKLQGDGHRPDGSLHDAKERAAQRRCENRRERSIAGPGRRVGEPGRMRRSGPVTAARSAAHRGSARIGTASVSPGPGVDVLTVHTT